MGQVEEREVEISRKFDYSNSVPEVQTISFLAQYCDSYYKQLMKMCEEDEEKNAKLKSEYKNFQYKKSYNTKYEVAIKEKGNSFSNLSCKTYDSFVGTSEILIGKKVNNLENRRMIRTEYEKYKALIPKELIALLVATVIVIIIGFFI